MPCREASGALVLAHVDLAETRSHRKGDNAQHSTHLIFTKLSKAKLAAKVEAVAGQNRKKVQFKGAKAQAPSAVCKHSISLPRPPLRSRISRPIQRVLLRLCKTMKRPIRPIEHPRDIIVFHRIEMHIVDRASAVLIVTNRVFSIAALPYASFSFRRA